MNGCLFVNSLLKDVLAVFESELGYHLLLLEDKTVTCFPNLSDNLIAADYKLDAVVVDETIITGRAAGASVEFGLKLVEVLLGIDEANRIKEVMFI